MNPTRPNTRWLEIGLMTAGLTLLGAWLALFALAGTEGGDARRAIESRSAGPGSDERKTYIGAVLYRLVGRETRATDSRSRVDGAGRIEIPGAGISARIAEGTANRSQVGPQGQPSLAVLEGRRETFYRGLSAMKPGDRINVTTGDRRVVYRVERTAIVTPGEVQSVGRRGPPAELMLVARYPFHVAGSAPQRFVVRAQAVAKS